MNDREGVRPDRRLEVGLVGRWHKRCYMVRGLGPARDPLTSERAVVPKGMALCSPNCC